jgi:hypothetical protein
MNATIAKTIHFNCPMCHEPVETPAAASGKLISCPSCGREFNSPKPDAKTPTSWLVVVCAGLAVAGALAIPLAGWAARHAAWVRQHESPAQLRQRFQAEAQASLSEQCTNAIVGLRSIIHREVLLTDANPDNWTAEVTADYVNRVGGVERVALPFNFWVYHSAVDGRDHVLCGLDRLKMARDERDALNRKFGLTGAAPANAGPDDRSVSQ